MTHELRNNKWVRQLVERGAAPGIKSTDEQINPSQCIHCGAELPHDVGFQEYHMLKEHKLAV